MKNDPLIINQNFQELLEIARIIDEEVSDGEFSIRNYYHKFDCGSIGCLIGHWAVSKAGYREYSDYLDNTDYGKKVLNVQRYEWAFLFGWGEHEVGKYPLRRIIKLNHNNRQLALARLRKYIYYKLHKREMLGDLTTKEGREKYERVRRTEGNHSFVEKALCRTK